MATPCFYLNVDIDGYDAEVFLNGAPIVRASRDCPCICLPPVSEWVVDGENELLVEVAGGRTLELGAAGVVAAEPGEAAARSDRGAGEGDSGEAEPPSPSRLSIAFCVGEVGELVEPGEERELLSIGPAGPEAQPPFTARGTIDASHPWGPWAWQSAELIDVDPASQGGRDIVKFIEELHRELSAGRLGGLLTASRVKFDEVAPCYGVNPADAADHLARAWPQITKPAGWTLSHWDEHELVLRSCCAGRVVEPITAGGTPILRQRPGIAEERWMMPIYIARIDGQLAIVR